MHVPPSAPCLALCQRALPRGGRHDVLAQRAAPRAVPRPRHRPDDLRALGRAARSTRRGRRDGERVARLRRTSAASTSSRASSQLYRELYPISPRRGPSARALTAAAKVGDARFWIKASVVQLASTPSVAAPRRRTPFSSASGCSTTTSPGADVPVDEVLRAVRAKLKTQEEGAGSRRIHPPADAASEAEVGRSGKAALASAAVSADGHRRAVPPARRAR